MKRDESFAADDASSEENVHVHIQLARTSQACMLAFERITGIHPTRWQVLTFLKQNGKSTQKDLARALAIDAGALTRLLKQLEAKDWITRDPNPKDNRFTDVKLTSKGRTLVSQIARRREIFLEQAMAGVDIKQTSVLINTLRQIEANLAK